MNGSIRDTEEFRTGFNSMLDEIQNTSFAEARDRFNRDNPVGKNVSTFAYGEFQALCKER